MFKWVFHTINCLEVTRNSWLVLLCKIWMLLNLVKIHQEILVILNLWLFLYSFSGYWVIGNLFVWLNQSCKSYMGPMLPPGSRNQLLIYTIFYLIDCSNANRDKGYVTNFILSKGPIVFDPNKPFQPNLMFASKAWAYLIGAPFK